LSRVPRKTLLLGLWLLTVAGCVIVITRTPIETDMAAFLPRSASIAQQVLTDQVNKGATSHLILAAIQGVPPPALAALSESLATSLRGNPAFIDVANGDPDSFAGVQNFIWRQRYLLSSSVTADHFTAAGLHRALQNDLGLLGSDMGNLLQNTLPSDPTGESLTLMNQLQPAQSPRSLNGVWVSGDASRALLLIYTAAPGFEIDAQQRDLALIDAAFQNARSAMPNAAAASLSESGPGVFAVRIRDTTKGDVTRLSMLATAGAAALLLFAYRSPLVLLLGLLPVASGALAAIAAVSLRFGFVHGVTLGFGVTLIGESIDYAIYLFTQTAPGESPGGTLARIWPTLRLGAATSIVGFSAMLFSNFVGFAQLGLFSIIGLAAAACVTRFILPLLIPSGFFAPGSFLLAKPLLAVITQRIRLAPLMGGVILIAGFALLMHQGGLWDGDLQNLSPIPAADQALDKTLRQNLGVADIRYFAVFKAASATQALQESEALQPVLQNLLTARSLAGFALPSSILPSERTQLQRQIALPDDASLRANFAQALIGTPFRPDGFERFFSDAATARTAPPLTIASLPPALALQLQSMLIPSDDGWTVIAPLSAVSDRSAVAAAFAAAGIPGLQFVDLDHESNQLLRTFQSDASKLAIIGCAAIVCILLLGLRSFKRVIAVTVPLAAAVIVTAALMTLHGGKLSIFMVVGFLLIVAVGSNYCLFFERLSQNPAIRNRAVASVTLANLCTVSAYGLMSASHIPVLHDIGMTVASGTLLSLLFGAIVSTPSLPMEPS